MNERNVAALAEHLQALVHDPTFAADLAMKLAARGVLLPSALSDGGCEAAADAGSLDSQAPADDVEHAPSRFRAELERIAKGEP